MKIVVPMPKEGIYQKPQCFAEIANFYMEQLPVLSELTKKAFIEKNKLAWDKIQQILFHWNSELFFNKADATLADTGLKSLLRNYLYKHMLAYMKRTDRVTLDCANNFSAETAIAELHQKATQHRITRHPFLKAIEKRGMPKDVALMFLENWYTDSRIFHLYIAAQSLNTPFELRAELYHNLYDELGNGDISRSHPEIYGKNFRQFDRHDVIEPLTESLYLFNVQVFHISLSGDFRQGMGGLGFIEINVPTIMEMIYEGLKKSSLTEDDMEFWPLHIELDKEHGEAWFDEMKTIITTKEHALSALVGGLYMLEARTKMLDALWQYWQETKLAA